MNKLSLVGMQLYLKIYKGQTKGFARNVEILLTYFQVVAGSTNESLFIWEILDFKSFRRSSPLEF
jgi:hypothetical protein